MKRTQLRSVARTTLALAAWLAAPSVVAQPAIDAQEPAKTPAAQPAPQERVAAVKKSFRESQLRLRQYEWIETTVTTLKDEEKSRKVNRCSYGAEGKLQKVPEVAPPEEKEGRGLIGRIKEKKKEELTDYMEEAAALVHRYLPPDPEKIQTSKDAGKASIFVLEPEKRARLEFRDYLQEGDALSMDIDLVDNKILALKVSTWLGKEKDAVDLGVKFDTLPDGTIYTSESVLDAKAKHVKVTVQNSGYRKPGQ